MGLPCIVFLVSPLASVGRLSAGWGTPERGLSETAAASLQQVEAVSTLGLSHPWLAARQPSPTSLELSIGSSDSRNHDGIYVSVYRQAVIRYGTGGSGHFARMGETATITTAFLVASGKKYVQ